MAIIPTKTPRFIKFIFNKYTWDFSSKKEKKLYLTFDDGPIPDVTEFVLDQLALYNAKATFFCIGDNIVKYPHIFSKILSNGHSVGNHTNNHLKAWSNDLNTYIENTRRCQDEITKHTSIKKDQLIFRPPYGQLSLSKLKALKKLGYQIILWDVLSKDWEQSISPEECLQNVINNTKQGSIIVFHDSIKASKNLKIALPGVLDHFHKKGFVFEPIVFKETPS